MRSMVVVVFVAATATPVGAQSVPPFSNEPAQSSTLLIAQSGPPWMSGQQAILAAPLLPNAAARYTVRPSGLDRIDPADMRVLGGEIGGNGVKGGAVVSLTWPTEP